MDPGALIAGAVFGAAAITVWVLGGAVLLVPAWYALTSLLAALAYSRDKSAARRDERRIPESTLLAFGLVGGWPGALVAQQALRHKTRKRSFVVAFWASVVLNVAALAAVLLWIVPAVSGR
ncbi:DUF1294 domain-containing protein [Agromyces sp. LHK192]|uniref:DUF1294 domain-containing protein n=1 Tax=Agromyces sp. LHK192 TaxID=2498704 RepID=UPI000FD74112|nr:DUF1294 domain-containing protein [Agromyces sp. LHK192]